MEQDFPSSALGLYLHLPFCLSRCGYCSFFSVPYRKSALDEYVAYLNKEKALYQSQLECPVATVYFGGGTPSLLIAEQIRQLLSGLNLLPEAEITLEINPLQITEPYLQALNTTPVNRLSIGVQSMNPEELNWLDRHHKPEQIKEKIALCRQFGYQNISLDLIYGLPDSSISSLQRTVEKYLTLKPEHISCYLLTLDNDCLKAKDKAFLPEDEKQAEQYEYICSRLKQEGYEHYEISNFALSGYASQHNLRYWHSDDYLALGASAAGWISPCRYQNPADLNLYYQGVDKSAAFPQKEELSEQRIVQDYLMMGLRLKEGIALDEFYDRFRFKLPELYGEKIAKLQKIGMLNLTEHNLALTEKALFVSNIVIRDLIL